MKEISKQEREERDFRLGASLAPRFEATHQFRRDEQVTEYLQETATRLASSSKDLQDAPLRVFVIKDPGKPWKNYSLPGNRIYLSGTLLSTIHFENEVAALLALELGNLSRRNVANQFPHVSDPENPLANDDVFRFPERDRMDALADAVEMLYQAGYDPRGMVSLLSKYSERPGMSPYNIQLVEKMVENTRRIIALHTPLRNPIVRSEKFLSIVKRMQKL